MKKMQDAELRVVKFELSDVIVASGSCPPVVADVSDCPTDLLDQCTNNSGCNYDFTPIGGSDPIVVSCPGIDN